MSKAIVITAGQSKFLVETDESVEVPDQLESISTTAEGVSEGLTPVVDIKAVGRKFADVNELIVGCCNELSDVIAKISQPEKFAVELGIKFVGEAGVPMLTKASGEANIKVSIEWKTNES
jgi:hypothetical protein